MVPDADPGRDRCMAPTGQRRGAHLVIARAQRGEPWCHHGVPVAGRDALDPDADLSGTAFSLTEPPGYCTADRGSAARCDPHRDGRADWALCACLLPAPRPALHHELYDALPRIHLGAFLYPGVVELRGPAP